jgi:hypothetical protein
MFHCVYSFFFLQFNNARRVDNLTIPGHMSEADCSAARFSSIQGSRAASSSEILAHGQQQQFSTTGKMAIVQVQ